ncbi:small ribosomal subunit protein uS2m isoform X2 [Diachasmimorpha longicaudata]|uniref:small ribosomal subunit protein uS2m isoform X2 n=1 Tax=Diachasmimorpha longicaudata TaxID=58733 RepID=UPI0030B8A97B
MAGSVARIFSTTKCHVKRPVGINFSQTPLSTQAVPKVQKSEDPPAVIDPLKHPDLFGVHELFTIKDLFDARVHFGHKIGSLDDRMKPYLYGSRLGHLIIDLDKTAEHLRSALNFTAHIAFHNGIILFVCRNPQATHLVEKTARECGEFAHTRFWTRGTFTNATRLFKAVTRLPDLCIFINSQNDVLYESFAVRDAAKMCIPSVGIVDTNCNPNLITYPVPGNDDSPVAHALYCKLFKEAILRGKGAREKLSKLTE